jgi:hypothetical protein
MAHILVDKNGLCTCHCHHTCVFKKTGSNLRCKESELNEAGYPTIRLIKRPILGGYTLVSPEEPIL